MSDAPGGPVPATEPGPAGPPAEDECTSCLGARGILLALAFAAFAAYCAADFATGGRLTAAALSTLAAVRGRAAPDA